MAFNFELRRFRITTGSLPTANIVGVIAPDGRCIYREYLSAGDNYSGFIVGKLTDLTDKYSTMGGYALTYTDPDNPDAISVSPTGGAAAGGTAFTITTTGTNSSEVAVTIGGAAATGVTWSGTQIKGTSPAGTAGARDIVVTTAEGTDTLVGGWTYS